MHGHVTKLEIARRQLATAIDLFFADRDFVSVYSLAANSWGIIDVLCRKAGIESFSIQVRENVPIGKDLKINYVNNPYRNFFHSFHSIKLPPHIRSDLAYASPIRSLG